MVHKFVERLILLTTNFTFMRFDVGVDHPVGLQRLRLRERLAAHITAEGARGIMDEHVSHHVRPLVEGTATFRTIEWPLTRMCELVSLQMMFL